MVCSHDQQQKLTPEFYEKRISNLEENLEVETVVELTFVLLLVMNGEKMEYTPYKSLAECLSVRRKIKRNVGHTNNFDQKWSAKSICYGS